MKIVMEIEIDGKYEGDIQFGLFNEYTPKSVENFKNLCTGEKGVNEKGIKLHYKGVKFQELLRD
jgi:peptidylprolyl isomerase